MRRYAQLVLDSPHNLVSRRARAELLTRHLPEGVALAAEVPPDTHRLLDVGTGGGLPGLVIAIARPDIEVHLLDSIAKKTRFLTSAAADLEVPVIVHTGRAEALQRTDLAASFDVVTARAVAPLARLVPLTLPFLRPGGRLYAVKGERWSDELGAATDVIQRSGARVIATPDEHVPGDVASAAPSSREPERPVRVQDHRPRLVIIEAAGAVDGET